MAGWLINTAFIMASGTSGGLTFVSISFAIGSLALFIDLLYRHSKFALGVIVAFGMVVCSVMIPAKLQTPYDWWHIKANAEKKFSFSVSDTALYRNLNKLTKIVSECEVAPKSLLAFPHMTVFNIFTGISPYQSSPVFWMDYLSEKHGLEVLDSLHIDQPDILVIWNVPNDVYQVHSDLFRGGSELVQKIYSIDFKRWLPSTYVNLLNVLMVIKPTKLF